MNTEGRGPRKPFDKNKNKNKNRKRTNEAYAAAQRASLRFPERNKPEWKGPIVDYKELDLLRKFMSTSSKMMSRKRAGTSAQEQKSLKLAIKRARYMSLIPYTGM